MAHDALIGFIAHTKTIFRPMSKDVYARETATTTMFESSATNSKLTTNETVARWQGMEEWTALACADNEDDTHPIVINMKAVAEV